MPQPRTAPMTLPEIRAAAAADPHGCIRGDILMSLNDLLENDFEWFLDRASCLLTGSPLLEDISYTLVGARDGDAIITISGSPHEILDQDAA